MSRRLRILTWHVHGNYLWNLTQVPHDFCLLVDAARSPHHSGRSGILPWGGNVHEVHAETLANERFDCVLYQSRREWDTDRLTVLTPAQLALPRIVLEHDTPLEHPTDTRHWCDDSGALLVHVTAWNALMWDAGGVPQTVVEHGVKPLALHDWHGSEARGLVVVNDIARRGRITGLDIWQQAARAVPLRLVGMNSTVAGGDGEVDQFALPALLAAHRFFFHPIRHTSLGLALIEAMLAGMPVVGLATTELVTVIDSGRNGCIDTRIDRLHDAMRALLRDRNLAAEWGAAGQRTARERFGIERFVADWLAVFKEVTT